ncbi:hypothetical protein MNZ22_08600 [Aeromonas encheleia]|uniref:hypothetical protein n=1 Tax=Aeromonas encheleia TaxID=73010 RepID=UPI001F572EF8|nr:hypothetical protein [Aeromonas encheleia]UNP90265.1 hypothetical protein MNZ22_08600 [Aeromonas encheleia]
MFPALCCACGAMANELPPPGTDHPVKNPDCHALQQDTNIDLKEVTKAGCQPSAQQLAKMMDNPVGNLVMLVNQFDYTALKGPNSEGTHYMGKYSFMPTFPISLGEEWNLINRIPITYISAPINSDAGKLVGLGPSDIMADPSLTSLINDPFDRTHGMGDLTYVGVFSPKQPIHFQTGKVVWGLGPTAMFPTATEDVLGTGKYALGPAVVAAYLGEDWSLGLFPQHWWSIAGDDDRKDVRLTNIQYFIQRNIPGDAGWHVGMSPNVTVNWKADSGNQVSFPVGLGASRIIKIGSLPVRIGAEVQYAVIHPDDQLGNRWNLRFMFVPVIPTFLF